AQRREFQDAYWIWDLNHSVEQNETLRAEGFRVLGGGRHAYRMEHDRQACLEFVGRYGLNAPPSYAFQNPEDAIRFCEGHTDSAYVYKPDNGANFETFLPDHEDPRAANEQMRIHLQSLADYEQQTSGFILQERKDGIETNVELWFQHGEPVFAFMTLEC